MKKEVDGNSYLGSTGISVGILFFFYPATIAGMGDLSRLNIKNSDAQNFLIPRKDKLHWGERSAKYVRLGDE